MHNKNQDFINVSGGDTAADNSNQAIDTSEKEKKLAHSSDMRDKPTLVFNHSLDLAIHYAGFKEIAQVGVAAGYSRSFISKVLHGRIKPKLRQAEDIARVLKVPLQKIFDMSDIRDLDFLKQREKDSE